MMLWLCHDVIRNEEGKKRIETIYFSSIERTTKNKTLIDPVTHMLFARVALNNVAKLFYFYVYTQRRTCINNQ